MLDYALFSGWVQEATGHSPLHSWDDTHTCCGKDQACFLIDLADNQLTALK